MSEKRMLIVDAEVIKKIDDNRGEMGRSDFISFLIDSHLKEAPEAEPQEYVSKAEFQEFERGMKELLRNFLEFFLSYGLELGDQPQDKAFNELTQKLQSFGAKAKKN